MRTVKSYKTKETTAVDLFGTKTCDYSSKLVKALCRRVEKIAKQNGHTVEFFAVDGLTLLAYHKEDITILMELPKELDITNCETWKFGFLNRDTGKINLLFGGASIVDAASATDLFKITCDVVKYRFQPTANEELIPFSIQQ